MENGLLRFVPVFDSGFCFCLLLLLFFLMLLFSSSFFPATDASRNLTSPDCFYRCHLTFVWRFLSQAMQVKGLLWQL